MRKEIGVAVAGTGFIGPVHVEALRRLGLEVVGVLENRPEKSAAAAQALGLRKGYAGYAELLADREVQAVHLSVPNRLHYPMAMQALEAGRHVMCEKPLAMNARESADLVQRAAASGLQAGVCYNIRYYPLNLQAREMVRQGSLGTVFSVTGSYVQDWLLYDTDYNWRVLAEEGGELRAVADIGTHWIDLLTTITGLELEAVFADLRTIHGTRRRPRGEVETFTAAAGKSGGTEAIPISTEDCGAVLLRFRGGARGVLWVSQATAGRKNCLRYEIAGSDAALAWNSEEPNTLWIGHRRAANEQLIRDPSLLAEGPRRFANYPGGHTEGFPDSFKQCFRAFYASVADPLAPREYPTFEDGHREVLFCEAVSRSNREQRWVTISP